jgi:hypothetical protein
MPLCRAKGTKVALQRRLLGGITLIVGGVLVATAFGYLRLPPVLRSILWASLAVLSLADLLMQWRFRKDQPLEEPSPARSAVGVITMTGAVAVAITAEGADGASDYVLPAAIAVATGAVAFAAFRFAMKHRSSIGEARFDTTSNDS